ncbi:unnamed protein product [Adineta ricciae]|uniref:Uncharacterized protein n=1 Tax=Adineta ricciae TaxID=249248 RepID=A0A814Z5V3_ADIRI|nr:unnamed protein product [Adineta ricciae]CAF1502019.1 unnamed protein product [Adineta ricciae]
MAQSSSSSIIMPMQDYVQLLLQAKNTGINVQSGQKVAKKCASTPQMRKVIAARKLLQRQYTPVNSTAPTSSSSSSTAAPATTTTTTTAGGIRSKSTTDPLSITTGQKRKAIGEYQIPKKYRYYSRENVVDQETFSKCVDKAWEKAELPPARTNEELERRRELTAYFLDYYLEDAIERTAHELTRRFF